jgi:hypothetical protein
MKESELADKIINYFESKGYITYKEVSMYGKGGDARADIYFVKKVNDEIVDSVVVETKTSFSTKVIQQADRWKTSKLSHRVYVCVPAPKRKDLKSRRFLFKVCKLLGIGVFQYYTNQDFIFGIKESVESDVIKTKKYPPLFEEQKDSIAGNDKSEYVTKFKLTVVKLNEFMKDKESYVWKNLIEEIDHHYTNDKSAMSALKKLIGGDGPIPGYYFEKIDKKITLIKGNRFQS